MNGKILLTLDAELVIITRYVIMLYVLWIYNYSTLFIKGATTRAAHAEAISFKIGHGSIIVSDWSKISFNFTAFPRENNACG